MACKTVCNICGKELDFLDEQEEFTLERTLGYGSKYDGDKLNLHICCDCMDKLIDSCKVNPIIPEEPEQLTLDPELLNAWNELIRTDTYTEDK